MTITDMKPETTYIVVTATGRRVFTSNTLQSAVTHRDRINPAWCIVVQTEQFTKLPI